MENQLFICNNTFEILEMIFGKMNMIRRRRMNARSLNFWTIIFALYQILPHYVEYHVKFMRFGNYQICIIRRSLILEIMNFHYNLNNKKIPSDSLMLSHAIHAIRSYKLFQTYKKGDFGNQFVNHVLSQLKNRGCKIFFL
eukprot:TRINITY_DN5140_c0_g1_i1.p2 TRINITY_DN5140_c0_g1~~TRINITY_DN5140_c0_g1_i1.p2  ORF type:complete len:140 (+),score=26.58 TRINITY_DN5140_c0_g1_i1:203-622(+)